MITMITEGIAIGLLLDSAIYNLFGGVTGPNTPMFMSICSSFRVKLAFKLGA